MSTNNRQIAAYGIDRAGEVLAPFSYEQPELGPWDIEVEISHCGICHSDLHLINDDWNLCQYPMVPGHEIIGIVKARGNLVTELDIGMRVGIGWQRSSCTHCEWCHQGEENLCLAGEPTCLGHFGGFANKIVADSRFAFAIPEALASENAAPLLCGGATTFSPFLAHNVDATMRVGVIGIGGLGHLALQFAKAFGCEVYAFSSSAEKEEEAKRFGADHFIPSNDKNAIAHAENSIDLLLSTSSGNMDWESFVTCLRPKGRLCLVGAPQGGNIDLPIVNLIMGSKSVSGSYIGSPPVIRKMLAFAARHGIVAQTELFAMSDVNTALKKLAANQIHYRAVLYNEG